MCMRKSIGRCLRIILSAAMLLPGLILGIGILYAVTRIFVADQFIIPTNSMEPTLVPGDRIIVDKTIMGARIYTNFDFLPEGQSLESIRLKGRRLPRHNDVAVFNFPVIGDTIGFRINYVYCKRIIGLPGDSVSIVEGRYINNNFHGELGAAMMQDKVAAIPDTLTGYPGFWCAPWWSGWSIRNYGPYYVPRKGDVVRVDSVFAAHYNTILRYETGREIVWDPDLGTALAGGKPIGMIQFARNYYFMAGDNAPDSNDSRYWGPVPEEHIVGIAGLISYSADRHSGKLNPDRILRPIK